MKQRQQGLAMIAAIIIAALVATAVSWLVWRQSLWIDQVENQRDLAAARSIGRSALDLGRLTLRDASHRSATDTRSDIWTIPAPAIKVESAEASGFMTDEQGRFNLADLIDAKGQPNPAAIQVFNDLCRQLQQTCPTAQLVTLLPNRLASPLRLAVLLDDAGYTQETRKRLRPFITWLPVQGSPINVNFASAELLLALMPGLGSQAQQLAGRLAGYTSQTELNKDYPATSQPRLPISLTSRYVVCEISVKLARVQFNERYFLDRQPGLPAVLDQFPVEE